MCVRVQYIKIYLHCCSLFSVVIVIAVVLFLVQLDKIPLVLVFVLFFYSCFVRCSLSVLLRKPFPDLRTEDPFSFSSRSRLSCWLYCCCCCRQLLLFANRCYCFRSNTQLSLLFSIYYITLLHFAYALERCEIIFDGTTEEKRSSIENSNESKMKDVTTERNQKDTFIMTAKTTNDNNDAAESYCRKKEKDRKRERERKRPHTITFIEDMRKRGKKIKQKAHRK